MELIDKREFAAAGLDKNIEIFVIYVATLSTTLIIIMQVYISCQVQVGLLLTDKALVKVPFKYLNYAGVFLFELAIELFKNTGINENDINLVESKRLL